MDSPHSPGQLRVSPGGGKRLAQTAMPERVIAAFSWCFELGSPRAASVAVRRGCRCGPRLRACDRIGHGARRYLLAGLGPCCTGGIEWGAPWCPRRNARGGRRSRKCDRVVELQGFLRQDRRVGPAAEIEPRWRLRPRAAACGHCGDSLHRAALTGRPATAGSRPPSGAAGSSRSIAAVRAQTV